MQLCYKTDIFYAKHRIQSLSLITKKFPLKYKWKIHENQGKHYIQYTTLTKKLFIWFQIQNMKCPATVIPYLFWFSVFAFARSKYILVELKNDEHEVKSSDSRKFCGKNYNLFSLFWIFYSFEGNFCTKLIHKNVIVMPRD